MKETRALRIGRFDGGYVIQLVGRGGVRESSTLRDYVQMCLRNGNSKVVVDLNSCDYLDSTSLGCIAGLHRCYGVNTPGRFLVAANPASVARILHVTKLEQFLEIIDEAPELEEEMRPVRLPTLGTVDLGRHVMECHQLLAELGGPKAEEFARIAERLGHDLNSTGDGLSDERYDERHGERG